MSQVAMCRRCEDEPLVSTFSFYKKEFICLGCGGLYEWLQPRGADETTKLLAKAEARKQEWLSLSDGHLPSGMRLSACEACSTSGDYDHRAHATPAELADNEAATARIERFREEASA